MGELKEFVEEIIADGVLTQEEHEAFMRLVHMDGKIDSEESTQITRIFTLLREGKLQIEQTAAKDLDRQKLEEAKKAAVAADLEQEQEELARNAASAQKGAERLARREAISLVLAGVSAEEEAKKNTIAEFLTAKKHDAELLAAEAAEKSKNTRTNTLLTKAKERYAESDE